MPASTSSHIASTDIFAKATSSDAATFKDFVQLFDTFGGTESLALLCTPTSIRTYYELTICVVEGQCDIEINGKTSTLTSQTLLCIAPENAVRITHTSTSLQCFIVMAHPQLVVRAYRAIGITYTAAQHSFRHDVASLSQAQVDEFLAIYHDIENDLLLPSYALQHYYVLYLLALMTAKRTQLMQEQESKPNTGTPSAANPSHQQTLYKQFLTLLNRHAIEQRSVSFYAQALNLSAKHLSCICIRYSQKNASAWIDEAVIQKAKACLLVHKQSIATTSQHLHFPTPTSFCRYFRRVTGLTPRKFIRQNSQSAKSR